MNGLASNCAPLGGPGEGLCSVESDHGARRPRREGFSFARRRCLLLAARGRAMRGSLGEKIGEGAFSDVHAWAPGQVVKLFKAGVPQRLSRHEARVTRAVFAAGAPAPEVLDEVTL